MPFKDESIDIATRFWAMDDSELIASLGVEWRDPDETLRDLFQ